MPLWAAPVLLPARHWSVVHQLVQNGLFRPCLAAVHQPHPRQWVAGFQRFRHARRLHQHRHHLFQPPVRRLVDLDGIDELIIIDARTYPVRSVDEPEDDKVLRGSHDGFVETLLFNVTLIRRRIRDPRLTMELFTIGSSTKTDVVLAYMNGVADEKVLETLRSKLSGIKTCSLNMAQESLAEMLVKKGWYNPFPKVRYTERPDTTAASIMEGKIAILCDNAPSAMLLPVGIFDFEKTEKFTTTR